MAAFGLRALALAAGAAVVTASGAHGQAGPAPEPPALHIAPPALHLMATDSFWKSRPTDTEIAQAYPADLRDPPATSLTSLRCTIGPDGRMRDCKVGFDEHPGQGFDRAALGLAPKFEAPTISSAGQSFVGLPADISFVFRPRVAPAPG